MLSEENKKIIMREEARRVLANKQFDVDDETIEELVACVKRNLLTDCGTKTQWRQIFPIGVLGHPMREFAPGKWESASWPSEEGNRNEQHEHD